MQNGTFGIRGRKLRIQLSHVGKNLKNSSFNKPAAGNNIPIRM
jgi:hypothetical protein